MTQLGTELSLADVEVAVTQRRRALDRDVGEARAIATRGKELTAEVARLERLSEVLTQAVAFLSSLGEDRQRHAQEQIEGLVTHGLQTIFSDDLSFHIVQETKANRVEVSFVVRSTMGEDVVETPVLEARGGGVAVVVGFLLRVVVLLLSRHPQPVLFLDEAFAQVSEDYEPRVAEFIRELVDRTPLQVVLVTHSHAYTDLADKVYRFGQQDGVTKIALLGSDSVTEPQEGT